jgi:hypothetical protein
MGSAKDIKGGARAEALYREMLEMKERIMAMQGEFSAVYGPGAFLTTVHKRHLQELADIMDWKLHIMTTGSPIGVAGAGEIADTVVSVRQPDVTGPDFSGGYLGG